MQQRLSVLAACLVLSASRAAAGPMYTITDLGRTSSRNYPFNAANSLNNLGQIGGTVFDGTRNQVAIYNPDGTMTLLGSTGDFGGLNNLGQAVFYSDNSYTSYLYSGGTVTQLTGIYRATAINDSGLIVGNSSNQTEFGTPGAFTTVAINCNSVAAGVNNSGIVIGTYENGCNRYWSGYWMDSAHPQNPSSIPPLSYPTDQGRYGEISSPVAINNRNEIVGSSGVSQGVAHAFLLEPGVGLIDLCPSCGASAAYGINNHGDIVGHTTLTAGFLYTPSLGLLDLNSLVDPSWPNDHNFIWDGIAINDSGQILADGAVNGFGTVFLLNPTESAAPEPSTWAGALMPLLAMAARRKSTARR